MKRVPRTISEKSIEVSILEWLKLKGIFAWKVENGGVYNQKRGVHIFSRTRTPGVADIIGIYNGKALAIEVKSEKGRLSDQQKDFLNRFELEGGIVIVARSIEDVSSGLAKAVA